MAEHPNLSVMRRTLAAFQAGDIPALSALLSPDVVWHLPGKSRLAGDYRGHEQVFGFFGKLMELTSGTFEVHSIDMLANDHGGIFVDRITAGRDGRKLDVRLLLHTVIRDGQIVEAFDYFHPEHLWDAFWE